MKSIALLVAIIEWALVVVPASAAVTVGGLKYSIQDVHVASSIGPDGAEQHANGEYIVVRLKVSNVGHDSATISGSDFHLRQGGTTFDSASESMYAENPFLLTTVNPGTSRTGTILFDVPAHTSPSKYQLEVYGNGGSDPTYIRL